MSAEINHKGNLKIEEYEFGAFLQTFQDAILEGYVLDLDSSENYPQKFGTMMEVTLVSTNFQLVEAEVVEDISEVTQEVVENTTQVDEKVNAKEVVEEVQPTEEKPVETGTRKRKNSAT